MDPQGGGPSWGEVRGVAGACRRLLRGAARLVPPPGRRGWLAERDAELWALWKRGRGGAGLIRFALEGYLDAWRERTDGRRLLHGLRDDLLHASRTLRRSPGSALLIVVVLAVGVGANTAVFSVLHAALLRPVGWEDPESLVAVDLTVRSPDTGEERALPFSWPAYEALDAVVSGRIVLAGFTLRDMTLLGAGDPARIPVEVVTPSYFRVLGTGAALGRVLAPSEAPPAEAPVVVLSDALWTSRFGRDPAVLGRSVQLNDAAVTVVGVMPPAFDGLTGEAAAWVSMALAPAVMDPARLRRPRSHWMYAVGRLPERAPTDVATDLAAGALRSAGPALAETAPGEDVVLGARLVPFLEARVNPTARRSIFVVGGAAALLLLIACANVAGILVARGVARRSELAVRAALGAGRWRLLRTHLAESLVLAALAGLGGVGGAFLGIRALAAGLPHAVGTVGANSLEFLDPAAIGLNGPVLAFGLLASAATGVLAGLWPAIHAGRSLPGAAPAGVRSDGGLGAAGRWGRSWLVAGQVALAVVLLAGAGLMLRSLAGLQSVDLGVDGRNDLVLARYELPRGTEDAEVVAFHRGLEDASRGLPGVGAASLAQCTPLSGRCDVTLAARLDEAGGVSEDRVPATVVLVGDDYFRVLGIPVLRGRTFEPGDGPESPLSVVLSEEAVAQLLPTGDPLGRHVTASLGALAEEPGGRVVGVVSNVRYDRSLAGPTRPAIYVSYRQLPVGYMTVVARSDAGTAGALQALRSAVGSLRPDIPLFDATTLQAQVRSVTARTRVVLALLVLFAGTALLLSAMGIYGLTSFVVARRTRELGVRMVMGATAGRLLRRVLVGAGVPGAAGLLAGLLGALWLTRLMEGLLFRTEPADPRVLAGVSVVLLLATLAAAAVPALRATRIDPAVALRAD